MRNETVDQFIVKFKKATNKCLVTLPKKTFVDLAFNGLKFEIREMMVGHPYLDLLQLSTIAIKHESLLREKDKRHSRKGHVNFTEIPDFNEQTEPIEVVVVQMIIDKLFICQALKPAKVKRSPVLWLELKKQFIIPLMLA